MISQQQPQQTTIKYALVLGMFFGAEAPPGYGQPFRDFVRIVELEKLGFRVRSTDDKHSDIDFPNHCNANFADSRRFFPQIAAKFSGVRFSVMFLDYFFCPIGYTRSRWEAWSQAFFSLTLQTFVRNDVLTADGEIWLPNLQNVRDIFHGPIYATSIAPYFTHTCI